MADNRKSGRLDNRPSYVYKGELAVYSEGQLPSKMYGEIITRHQSFRLQTRPTVKPNEHCTDHRAALIYVSKDLKLPGVVYEKRFTLENFTVKEYLGGGAYGRVWKVINRQTGVSYAMKQINLQLTSHSVDVYKERDFMFSLLHKRICQIFGSFFDTDPFMLLELCVGHAHKLPETVSQFDRVRYGIQLMDAVEYIHSKQIIHCDIKPSNILISNLNNVKLTDFGSAMFLGNAKSFKSPWLVSTLGYCNYKGMKRFECDYTTDIFGTACSLYEMTTTTWFLYNEAFGDNIAIFVEAIINGRLKNFKLGDSPDEHPREFLDERATNCVFGDVMKKMLPRNYKTDPKPMKEIIASEEMQTLKQRFSINELNIDSETETSLKSNADSRRFEFYGQSSDEYRLQETIFMTFYVDPEEKEFGYPGEVSKSLRTATSSKEMQTDKILSFEHGCQTDETGAAEKEIENAEKKSETRNEIGELQEENQNVSEGYKEVATGSAEISEIKTGANKAEQQEIRLKSSAMVLEASTKTTGTNTASGKQLTLFVQEPAINVERFLFNMFLEQPEIKQIKSSLDNNNWEWIDILKKLKDKWVVAQNMAGGSSPLPSRSIDVRISEQSLTPVNDKKIEEVLQLVKKMAENCGNPPSAKENIIHPPSTSSQIRNNKVPEPPKRTRVGNPELKHTTTYGRNKKDVDEKKQKACPRREGKKRRRESSESASEPETRKKTPPIIKSRVVQDKKKKVVIQETEKIKDDEKKVKGKRARDQVTNVNKKTKGYTKKDEEKSTDTEVTQKNAKKHDVSSKKRVLRNAKAKPKYVVSSEEEKDDETDEWLDRETNKKIEDNKKITKIAAKEKKEVTTGEGKKVNKEKERESSDEEVSSDSDEDVNYDELFKNIREKYKDQLSSTSSDDSSSDESDE